MADDIPLEEALEETVELHLKVCSQAESVIRSYKQNLLLLEITMFVLFVFIFIKFDPVYFVYPFMFITVLGGFFFILNLHKDYRNFNYISHTIEESERKLMHRHLLYGGYDNYIQLLDWMARSRGNFTSPRLEFLMTLSMIFIFLSLFFALVQSGIIGLEIRVQL